MTDTLQLPGKFWTATVTDLVGSPRLVEGSIAPVDVTLIADGQPINAAGTTVRLVLRDRLGALVPIQGAVAWRSIGRGVVRYTPSFKDLKAVSSPCAVRLQVTDAAGRELFFPNGDPALWTIRK